MDNYFITIDKEFKEFDVKFYTPQTQGERDLLAELAAEDRRLRWESERKARRARNTGFAYL